MILSNAKAVNNNFSSIGVGDNEDIGSEEEKDHNQIIIGTKPASDSPP